MPCQMLSVADDGEGIKGTTDCAKESVQHQLL